MIQRSRVGKLCSILGILLVLLWTGHLYAVQAEEDEVPGKRGEEGSGGQMSEDEERTFESRRSVPRRILALPKYIWCPLKYPTKKALIWSERVDLPERIMDILYFNEERTAGWFPNFSFGGKTGAGAGASIFHEDMFGQDKEWRFSFLYSNPGEWYVDAMAQPPEICENRFSPGIYFEAYEQDEEDFYINLGRGRTGNDTREKDDRKYEIGRARIRFNLPYAITDVFTVGTNIDLDLGDVEDGHDLVPIPRFVEGAYGDIIYYVGGNGYLRVDTRDSDYRASRGWYVECGGGARTNFSGSDAADRDLTFYFYDVDVQRYLKLFSIFRSVVVRTRFSKTEPFEGGPRHGVPFYFQPALDEDNALRGYERGRYRDRGALLFNVEYRYPIWDTWDGVVFLDEGQVFRHYEDLTLDGFHWSAGLGARFSGKKGFLFRVQAAFSDEMHPLLLAKMEQVF